MGAEALFDLDGEYKSKIDFTKTDNPKVRALLNMKARLPLDRLLKVSPCSTY